MGVIKKVKCNHCGYSKDFFLGVGMLGGNLDTAKKNFPDTVQKEIDQWIAMHGYQRSVIEGKLGTCSTCDALELYNELTVFGTDETKVSYVTKCKKCNSEMKPIVERQLSCPTCGYELTMEVGGHWD